MAELAKDWDNAKKSFEATTGMKKPAEKSIKTAFQNFTGLSKSLEDFDKAEKAAAAANNGPKDDLKKGSKLAEAMGDSLKKFIEARGKYTLVLEKEIGKVVAAKDAQAEKTAYERGLKFLKKELDALETTAASRVDGQRQRFDKGMADTSTADKILLLWDKNMKACLARAVAEVAKVKTKMTVEAYNDAFPKAARDVTMQLVNATKLDYHFQVEPKDLLAEMKPWGEQNGKAPATLPDDATPDVVKKNLEDFIVLLKRGMHMYDTMRK